jgi:hypothetical protein
MLHGPADGIPGWTDTAFLNDDFIKCCPHVIIEFQETEKVSTAVRVSVAGAISTRRISGL